MRPFLIFRMKVSLLSWIKSCRSSFWIAWTETTSSFKRIFRLIKHYVSVWQKSLRKIHNFFQKSYRQSPVWKLLFKCAPKQKVLLLTAQCNWLFACFHFSTVPKSIERPVISFDYINFHARTVACNRKLYAQSDAIRNWKILEFLQFISIWAVPIWYRLNHFIKNFRNTCLRYRTLNCQFSSQ